VAFEAGVRLRQFCCDSTLIMRRWLADTVRFMERVRVMVLLFILMLW
jgi:hypothetical protein